jgi:hypothetical protein
VGPWNWDPRVAVLAVAVCRTQGGVVLRIQKPVERFVGGRMILEVMALMEGLDAALGLGIHSVTAVTGSARSTTMYAMTTLYPSNFTYFILVD